ncbi:glycosyltransferase family 2 protein [Vibrio wakamikoensis]|uniref:glycosyltransferase family 2 protein n=1 Tax=Vibrio wakamikoensis TaxID=2910251 RepID=UPI003D227DDD
MTTTNTLLQTDWAVIVFYQPDDSAINHALWLQAQYQKQGGGVVVVDNTTETGNNNQTPTARRFKHSICYGENLGIAKALNDGIDYAKQHGATWCFLFDQDSRPDTEFFLSMRQTILSIDNIDNKDSIFENVLFTGCTKKHLRPVAAIAPVYFDTNLQRSGSIIQIEGHKLTKRPANAALHWASYTITSGSCVNLAHYDHVGPHDESLFIDFVDIDWGLRANALGHQILVVPAAKLTHCLGITPVSICGLKVVNHSPLRHYYYFRNMLHMLRRPYVPWVWKGLELIKAPIRFAVYSVFTQNRMKHMQAMIKGLYHGVLNKSGQYP